jgi:hypothetical protein
MQHTQNLVYNEFIVPPTKYYNEFKMVSRREKLTEMVIHDYL